MNATVKSATMRGYRTPQQRVEELSATVREQKRLQREAAASAGVALF